MRAVVRVMPKPGVLDPQGAAIAQALAAMGHEGVGEVRQGKLIELELPEGTAEATVREMCEALLANTVIESYEVDFG